MYLAKGTAERGRRGQVAISSQLESKGERLLKQLLVAGRSQPIAAQPDPQTTTLPLVSESALRAAGTWNMTNSLWPLFGPTARWLNRRPLPTRIDQACSVSPDYMLAITAAVWSDVNLCTFNIPISRINKSSAAELLCSVACLLGCLKLFVVMVGSRNPQQDEQWVTAARRTMCPSQK